MRAKFLCGKGRYRPSVVIFAVESMLGNKREKGVLWEKTKERIKEKRTVFVVYLILVIVVVGILIRSVFIGAYQNAALCALSLFLFMLPGFAQQRFGFELPSTLEIIVLCFIFAAEILGEIRCYYVTYPGWDTMLHTLNGFLCAAIGFALLDMFNRSEQLTFKLSPMYLALVAFCFSMTVGVLWEFFEFGMDSFFGLDMQKDRIVESFSSVILDPNSANNAYPVRDITQTVIHTASGGQITVDGGYLDIGIYDTMKDLWVNFVGAVVFSFIGFFYVKNRGRGRFARQFIPKVKTEDEGNA